MKKNQCKVSLVKHIFNNYTTSYLVEYGLIAVEVRSIRQERVSMREKTRFHEQKC